MFVNKLFIEFFEYYLNNFMFVFLNPVFVVYLYIN